MRQPLGQHFLRDPSIAARMVEALGVAPPDTVVEIGPGRGALTSHLAGRCARLVLIERDPSLAATLKKRFASSCEVVVVEDDAAKVPLAPLLGSGQALVIGNLPYEASTAILANLLRHRRLVSRMVLMFQREVAARIAAIAGTRRHGALSLIVQVRCRVEPLMDVGPERFSPPPRVWSRVLRLTPHPADDPFSDAADSSTFDALAHALHAHPRKTVLNSLAAGLGIPRALALSLLDRVGIPPTIRPSHVALDQAVFLWRIRCSESGYR